MERDPIFKTIEQAKAKYAWECVETAKDQLKSAFDRYVVLVTGFPAEVKNDLGQAMASLYARMGGRKPNENDYLLSHIQGWLTGENLEQDALLVYWPPYYASTRDGQNNGILECIMKNDGRTYLRASVETLRILEYIRKYAKGMAKEISATDTSDQESSGVMEE